MQRALVERAQQGDHDAFGQLVDASYPRLFRAANLILRDADRAQDAVQEALVEAWRHIRALRDPDAWDAWLHRTTARACYKSAAREKRRALVELRAAPQRSERVTSDASIHVAERDRIGRELDALDVDRRTVLVLHYYLGMTLPEVAEILDVPVGTVNSRLHRALKTMRVSMGAEAHAHDDLKNEGSA